MNLTLCNARFAEPTALRPKTRNRFVGLERAPRLARTGRARKLASSTSNLVRGAIVYNSHRLDLTGLPYGIPRDLKMFFRAQGKLHHPFEQLVRGQAREIAHDQLLGVEPHKVAKLQRLAA